MTNSEQGAGERLRQIKKRCEKATVGPWSWIGKSREIWSEPNGYGKGDGPLLFLCAYRQAPYAIFDLNESYANCDFVAHAREDVPWLLDHVSALRAKVADLEKALVKITNVSQFGRDGGAIVTSEHYEAAWLDCVEIAREALRPDQGEPQK